MGLCESCQGKQDHKNAQNNINPYNQMNSNSYNQRNINTNEINQINGNLNNIDNKTKETDIKAKNIINQNIIKNKVLPIPSGKEEKINEQMKISICKIYANQKVGTGFLCLIPFPDQRNRLSVLVTNKDLINEEEFLKMKKIEFTLDNDKEEKIIYMTSERKIFSSKKYNTTFIEIFPGECEDNQLMEMDNNFSEADISKEDILQEKKKGKNDIYIIQYINETSCIKSYGIINNIQKENINHTCSKEPGGPILYMKNQKIIGLNIGKGKGILLKEPIKEFYSYISNKNKSIKIQKNYIECFYIIKNGEEFNLLHDYNNTVNKFVDDFKNIDGKDKKKFIEDNINIYVDSQPIQFNYKYKTSNNKINVKFIFKKILNDLSFMFFNCQNLESIDFSSYDMSNITDMNCMFSGCSNLKSVNLTSLKTNNDIDIGRMFSGCLYLKIVDFPSDSKINVTNLDRFFFSCSSIESIDLSSLNTFKVKDMNRLFSHCNYLKIVNISSFQTINVIDMSRMFILCNNLKSIDLSNFDTRNVETMNDMFFDCRSLVTLDLSSFNTSKVKYMHYMFMACISLKSINLSSFNTINVINMSSMFHGCESLKNLDLSSFRTPNLISMDCIFSGCRQLESVDLSQFSMNNVILGSEVANTALFHGNQMFEALGGFLKPILENIFFGCFFLKCVKSKDKLILDMFNKNKEFINSLKYK